MQMSGEHFSAEVPPHSERLLRGLRRDDRQGQGNRLDRDDGSDGHADRPLRRPDRPPGRVAGRNAVGTVRLTLARAVSVAGRSAELSLVLAARNRLTGRDEACGRMTSPQVDYLLGPSGFIRRHPASPSAHGASIGWAISFFPLNLKRAWGPDLPFQPLAIAMQRLRRVGEGMLPRPLRQQPREHPPPGVSVLIGSIIFAVTRGGLGYRRAAERQA